MLQLYPEWKIGIAGLFYQSCILLLFGGLCVGEDLNHGLPSETEDNCPVPCSCERTSSRLSVDCSYRKLTSVPDFSMLKNDEVPIDIYLDGNIFSYIIGTSLWYVGSRLRSLHITKNERVFKIGERTFSQPHYRLKILKLSPIENDLESDLKSILEAKTLEKVYIETRSSIKTPLEAPLSDGRIADLSLKVLHIHDSGVSSIGHMAMAGLTLKELGLSKNLLTEFPIVLWYMISETLEILYLDDNRITELKRTQFPRGCKLRKLFLQNNIISVIELDTLGKCQDLEVINLAGNSPLATLDASLFVHFDNLHLDLRSTAITRFDFVASYQLEVLLAYNENRFCKCKEVSPYLLKFRSKLKGVCRHPDTNEKVNVHDLCTTLSTFEYIDDDEYNSHAEKEFPIYGYDTQAQPSRFGVESGLVKFLDSLFGLSSKVIPSRSRDINVERTRSRESTDDRQKSTGEVIEKPIEMEHVNQIKSEKRETMMSSLEGIFKKFSTDINRMLPKLPDNGLSKAMPQTNVKNEWVDQTEVNTEFEHVRDNEKLSQVVKHVDDNDKKRDVDNDKKRYVDNDKKRDVEGQRAAGLTACIQSCEYTYLKQHYYNTDNDIKKNDKLKFKSQRENERETSENNNGKRMPTQNTKRMPPHYARRMPSQDDEKMMPSQDDDRRMPPQDDKRMPSQGAKRIPSNDEKRMPTQNTKRMPTQNAKRMPTQTRTDYDDPHLAGKYRSAPNVKFHVHSEQIPGHPSVQSQEVDEKNATYYEDTIRYISTPEVNDLPLFACLLLIGLTYVAYDNLSRMKSFRHFEVALIAEMVIEDIFNQIRMLKKCEFSFKQRPPVKSK